MAEPQLGLVKYLLACNWNETGRQFIPVDSARISEAEKPIALHEYMLKLKKNIYKIKYLDYFKSIILYKFLLHKYETRVRLTFPQFHYTINSSPLFKLKGALQSVCKQSLCLHFCVQNIELYSTTIYIFKLLEYNK